MKSTKTLGALFAIVLLVGGMKLASASTQSVSVQNLTLVEEEAPALTTVSGEMHGGGHHGYNGYNGYHGYNGHNGWNGYNGYNGYRGYNGWNGYNGYYRGYCEKRISSTNREILPSPQLKLVAAH